MHARIETTVGLFESEYAIITYPECTPNETKEYKLIAGFFGAGTPPSPDVLRDEKYILDELLYRKTARSDQFMSFLLTTQNTQPDLIKPNPFNHGGYRYFCGTTVPEITMEGDQAEITYSTFFFETFLPFTSFFRDLLSLMLAQIKVERLGIYQGIIDSGKRFKTGSDYASIGSQITEKYLYKETHPVVGTLPRLYWADIYQGIELTRVGRTVSFKADIINSGVMHSLEALNLLPEYITPKVVLTVLGAVLQECVVVVHSVNRKVCYDVISLILSLIAPVCWPYPVIPLLRNEAMTDFVDSPVPLICGIEEDPNIFEARWAKRSQCNPHTIHIQLERGQILGKTPVDFIEKVVMVDSKYHMSTLEELHRQLCMEIRTSITDSMHELIKDRAKSVSLRIEVIRQIKRIITSIYIDPLKRSTLKNDKSKNYADTISSVIKNSKYQPEVLEAFLQGQIYNCYLESQLAG